MKFLNSNYSLEESNVVVFGIQLGRKSEKSLDSLRRVSQFVEPIDLDSNVNLLENVKIYDIGNINLTSFDEITNQTRKILEMKKLPLILGGNHLSSLYSLKAFQNFKLIVFDAHGDFKNYYEDEKIKDMNFVEKFQFNPRVNDATWLRRFSETTNSRNILLLGVRSCDEFEFNDLKNNINYFTSRKIKENKSEVIKYIESFTENSDIYISLDIDVFDPSIAPAVDMPEPDGIFFHDFQQLIKAVKGKIVGIDVCCLSSIPNNEITEFLVTRSIFEMLALIK